MEEIINKIEAILFASGKGLTLEQLVAYTEDSEKSVKKAVQALQKKLEENNGSIVLSEHNDKWKLTVRGKYLEYVKNLVSETELSSPLLKTLAVIAFKSPVLQSDIIHMRGQSAYEHIKELVKQKFVTKDEEGRSYLLKITDKFYNYFDVEGDEEIQEVFQKLREQQREIEELKIVDMENQSNESQQQLGGLEVVSASTDHDHEAIFEGPVRKEKTDEERHEEQAFLKDIDSKIEELSKRVEGQELPSRQGEESEDNSEDQTESDGQKNEENEPKEEEQYL